MDWGDTPEIKEDFDMGLRINTNVSSIGALRNLHRADEAQKGSLERLSTGLRINRASDDPSGLVISEQLRAQIRGMKQAVENSQNASNLMGTAEAALDEVNSLLIDIRESVVFAMNTGGNDPAQIDAEQDSIDNALRSIDRISQTTRFATRNLLDGSSGINTLNQAAVIEDINVQSVTFDDFSTTSQTFTINTGAQLAEQANLSAAAPGGGAFGTFSSTTAGVTLRVTGSQGTRDITVMAGATAAQFRDAINTYTSETGIYADGTSNEILSVEYGSRQSASIEVMSGDITTTTGVQAVGTVASDDGVDLTGDVNGIAFKADGFNIRVVSDVLSADIRLDSATAVASTAYTFDVKNDGLVFQLNQSYSTADREQVGLKNVSSAVLGSRERIVTGMGGNNITIGGFLSSMTSGSANDLSTNAANALRIVDEAINEISDHRAYLGAFQSQTIDTNLSSLRVAIENLSATESTIRDLDFAEETAAFTRNQILYQSGIAVLAQSNLISQSVLTLLA